MARTEKWWNHWGLILIPSKTKFLIVSTSRIVNNPQGELVLSGASIWASPNLDILAWSLTESSPLTTILRCIVQRSYSYCLPCLSENWYFEVGATFICDTSVLRCCFAFVLPILEYSYLVWGGSAAECTLSFLSAKCNRWAGFVLIRVSRSCVIDVMLLGCVCYTSLIRTLVTVCSESFHLLLLEFDRAELRLQLIHWSLKYQGVERPNLQGVSYRPRFECGMTFPPLCLTPERWMGSRVQSPGVMPSPDVRVTVVESLIPDLGKVGEWYDLWGIKLNASKTKTMIVTRSRTMHPQLPH